jgi:hypothetical protein
VPSKDPEKRRATVRAWYARTKHERGAADAARREANRELRDRELREWYAELKSALVCTRCGEDHPACLQFHHSDPSAKETSIADAVRRGFSRKRVLAEIRKCEVLCANCHLKHHAKERTT